MGARYEKLMLNVFEMKEKFHNQYHHEFITSYFDTIALGNLMGRKTNPGRINRRFDRKPPNRRQSSGFGQVSC